MFHAQNIQFLFGGRQSCRKAGGKDKGILCVCRLLQRHSGVKTPLFHVQEFLETIYALSFRLLILRSRIRSLITMPNAPATAVPANTKREKVRFPLDKLAPT